MPAPEVAGWYEFPDPAKPIKTGDVFRGGAIVAPGNPLLSLDSTITSLRDPEPRVAYDGPIFAHAPPIHDAANLGPIVDEAVVGIGYFILLSYTCDYAEPAKDHAFRLIAPLWDIAALPNSNGLRGFVWNHPDKCPAIFFPLPAVPGHFGKAFVNLRQMGLIRRELLHPGARVAALTQPAKHLLWQKLGFFFTRVRPALEQLVEVDAKYATPGERP